MSIDDAELLQRYVSRRSEEAFAELVRRYVGLVYHTALRQMEGRTDAAEDVAQSVFVLLARKAAGLLRHESLAGWLHTNRRSDRRRMQRELGAHVMHDQITEPNAEASWDRLRPVLDDVLGELKPNDREAILLRFFSGMSLAEIGARLAVSENAARMRVERALEQLRTRLVRRGVTSTAEALGLVLAHSAAASAPTSLAATITSTALAGAATGTAGAGFAGLLISMNNTKLTVGLATVLSVGGVGSAVWQTAAVRETESALANIRRERDVLQARLREVEDRSPAIGRTRDRVAAMTGKSAANGSANADARSVAAHGDGSTAAPPAARPSERSSVSQMLMRNPAFRNAELQRQRANFGLKYGPLYRSLRLSPEQIGEFEDAMYEWFQTNMETSALAAEQGLRDTDPKLAGLVKPALDNLTARLRLAIGEEGLKQLGPYEQTNDARETVSLLAGNLYYTDVPLSLAQAEQLTRIVAANTAAMKVSGIIGTPRELNWDAILTQAQGALAPAQLATLRRIGDRTRYQRTAEALATGAEAGASGAQAADASSTAGRTGGG